jgi:hypothetical protein
MMACVIKTEMAMMLVHDAPRYLLLRVLEITDEIS